MRPANWPVPHHLLMHADGSFGKLAIFLHLTLPTPYSLTKSGEIFYALSSEMEGVLCFL
jgi:hypothetical protein